MRNHSWARMLALSASLSVASLAGDYGHVLDVVKQAWPERNKGLVVCSLEQNQFTLLDLVETAKERNLSLVIQNIKDIKELEGALKSGLNRRPDFILIIDDDPVLGPKGSALTKLVWRAGALAIPSVGLSPDPLKVGAALSVGSAADAKVLYNAAVLKRMNLAIPEGAVDFTVAKVAAPVLPAPPVPPAPAPAPAQGEPTS